MTSTSIDLSIIILFKEKNSSFYRTLASAQFATEIILVQNSEIIDFAQVRNQALKKASHEWVFFLDSDEIITHHSIPEIKQIVAHNTADGILVNRQDIFYRHLIKHGETGNTRLLRMGKKNMMHWVRPVHEVAKIDGRINKSNIKLVHCAHQSISEFISAISHYAQLEAQHRFSKRQPSYLIEMITFPIGKFIHNFFLKKGFLDGWAGFGYAMVMSLHSFWVRVYLSEMYLHQKSQSL